MYLASQAPQARGSRMFSRGSQKFWVAQEVSGDFFFLSPREREGPAEREGEGAWVCRLPSGTAAAWS